MDISVILATIVVGYLSVLVITIIHETGHALVAGLFTKQKIKVFIGSYGKTDKNYQLQFGLYQIYIERNLLKLDGGLCKPEGKMTIFQTTLHILAGPLLPLIFGVILFCISKFSSNKYAIFIATVFLAIAAFSFLINLFPRKHAVRLVDGRLSPNDGYLLWQLFRFRNFYKEYDEAITLFNNKEYERAGEIFGNLLANHTKHRNIYQLAIMSYIYSNKPEKAKPLIDSYLKRYKPKYDDMINIGYYYSVIDEYDLALEYYKKSLDMRVTWYAYNNIGFQLTEMGKYKKAIKYLDKAVQINNHAYAYNNRGLAKIKMGNTKEGLEDIEMSRELDVNNAYYFKSMGIYHFDRGEYGIALDFFVQAKNIDTTTFKIDKWIYDTQQKLN